MLARTFMVSGSAENARREFATKAGAIRRLPRANIFQPLDFYKVLSATRRIAKIL